MGEFQVLRLVTCGTRPDRLITPIIDDKTWDIIQRSWLHKPSERPTMQQIVKSLVNMTGAGHARNVDEISLGSGPSEHLTKAQIVPLLPEIYPSPVGPSLPIILPSSSPGPSSSVVSATATSLSGVFHTLLASLNEVSMYFEGNKHRN